MRSHWPELLQVEAEFLALEARLRQDESGDYRQIPPPAFAWQAWDLLPLERLAGLILPCLRRQLARARHAQPALYAHSLASIEPQAIRSLADWQRVPLLVKDDLLIQAEDGRPATALSGFRSAAAADPHSLRPNDARGPLAIFGSGGSLGKWTPTFVSQADREREIHGWRRAHAYHGLQAGDVALYTYNTTHKGGQWMQESLWAHGVDVLLRRPEETPQQVLENLRDYRVKALFTVQQPYERMQNQAKAGGVNLHELVMASLENPDYRGILLPDDAGRRQIEFVFLGGFEIVPYALELAQEYLGDMPVATLLGSSEAIPQACSTNPALTPGALCHHNALHLLQGPHYIELVKADGQGGWAPVAKGEQGLLVYTSWARDGTLWIRYAPGDVATLLAAEGECPCGLHSPVIANVHRQNEQAGRDLLIYGCAAG